jgi:hypothetical protein
MALARYSGDCAPVTRTPPPKMKQGNDVAIETLELAYETIEVSAP